MCMTIRHLTISLSLQLYLMCILTAGQHMLCSAAVRELPSWQAGWNSALLLLPGRMGQDLVLACQDYRQEPMPDTFVAGPETLLLRTSQLELTLSMDFWPLPDPVPRQETWRAGRV